MEEKKNQTQALALSTKRTFLEDFRIQTIQKKCGRIKTIRDALGSEYPTIATLKKKFGEDFIQAYIEGWIVNIREFINVGKKMTDVQTQDTALIIVQEFYNLNIADVNLIFKNAKLGRYGHIYDRLDGQIILSWFEQYFSERCGVAAELSVLHGDKYKSDPYPRQNSTVNLRDFLKNM